MIQPDLITEFQQGYRGSFSQIYWHYRKPLLIMAEGLVGLQQEAEDIVMDCFRKLWIRHAKFTSIENVQAFLYITTRNACLDYLKMSRRRKLREKEFWHRSITNSVAEELSYEIVVAISTLVTELINDLPIRYRRVIYLSYLRRMKNKEIASRLNLSIQTVKNQRSQALKILKKNFIEHLNS